MVAFLVTLLILDGLLLMAVVLLQAGKGGGLAAVGGGASTDNFIGGRQAATLLTRTTWIAGAVFLALSLVLAVMSSRDTGEPRSILQQEAQPAVPQPLDVPGAAPSEEGGAVPGLAPAEDPSFEGREPATAPGVGQTGDAGDPAPAAP
mgnify:CR=1 FL=1